jgi:murein endopeptidase
VLAGVVFVAAVAGGIAYFVADRRSEDPPSEVVVEPVVVAGAPSTPVANVPSVVEPPQPPVVDEDTGHERSLETITWTIATPTSIDGLAQTWSLSRETLTALNPALPTAETLAAGTRVVVHTGSITTSESVGSPNDGRLIGGVPFPEGRTWLLPGDRSRAFGTGETLTGILAALDAYAAAYPEAAPIQLGEISARRGGPIYGHQSHQAGRDIDIRLVVAEAGDRFDPERNWFLVKTLVESGEVVSIFLNRSQQVWLRAAAEADVGVADAARYFAIVKHEPGHVIHIHVRFRCPESDRRCVAYSLDETDAEVAKKLSKLPSGGGGGTLVRKKGKLPTLRPKTKPQPSKNLPRAPAKGR